MWPNPGGLGEQPADHVAIRNEWRAAKAKHEEMEARKLKLQSELGQRRNA